MPGFDGTGPRGLGPRTGGGRGFCLTGAGPALYGAYAPYGGYPYRGFPYGGNVYGVYPSGAGRGGFPRGGGRGRAFGGGRGRCW